MRLVVFFDLPVETAAQRKAYRQFRKYLLKSGYLMLQESVYAKLAINEASATAAITHLRNNRPSWGLVQVLKVTEKQFSSMVNITGDEPEHSELTTTEELVIL